MVEMVVVRLAQYHGSVAQRQLPQDQAEQGCLTGPRVPDDPAQASWLDPEGHPVEGRGQLMRTPVGARVQEV